LSIETINQGSRRPCRIRNWTASNSRQHLYNTVSQAITAKMIHLVQNPTETGPALGRLAQDEEPVRARQR
jgi:hypothetical protein